MKIYYRAIGLALLLLVTVNFLHAQSLALQSSNARATGYAIVAARNPGVQFSVFMIPWDGVNTLEYNANNQINGIWHAQAAVKGNYFDQVFDGNDFTTYSSVVLSQEEFDLYKSSGTQWWIVCSTLPMFSNGPINQVNGKVGIGTTAPSSFLHLVGNSTTVPELSLDHYQSNMGSSTLALRRSRGTLSSPAAVIDQDYIMSLEGWSYLGTGFGRSSYIASQANGASTASGTPTDLIFATNAGGSDAMEGMRLDKNGNLGIGTTLPTEKLSVKGKIRAHEIKVETTNWPDYVFEEGYHLPTLIEIENHIKANKRLPEMPSAKTVEENGLELGALVKLQQKKIEELTLHLIEKDKQLKNFEVRLLEIEKNKK
jgi:hypothetical protein